MRHLAILLVFATAPLSAATITFEEFSVGDTTIVTGAVGEPIGTLESQGYFFRGLGFSGAVAPIEAEPAAVVAGNSGSNAWGASFLYPGLDSFGADARVSMRRVDGGAFAIHSLDLFYQTDNFQGFTLTSGTLAGGGAANLSVPVGTGDWLNLEIVSFNAVGDGFGFGGQTIVQIDNIVVSAVPVPAAAWLFGSGLAALGWMRRRKS